MTSVFSNQEVHALFDQYLLGSQESSLQQVTLRIMELSILKDPEQRYQVLSKMIHVLTSKEGHVHYYPIQSLYKRIESLLILFIRDLESDESEQLTSIFVALINLFRKSFEHYQTHPDNELFQFVKSHLDDQNVLQFNALQLKPCLPCLLQCKKPAAQELIKIMSSQNLGKDVAGFDLKISDNQYWISLKKFYDISTIKIDLKESTEGFLKEIKIFRSNSIQCSIKQPSTLELIEPASVSQQGTNIIMTFSPAFRAETLIFNFSITEQVGNCGCGFRGREARENPFWMQVEKGKSSALYCQRCGEHFLLKQIQISNQMTLNVLDLPINDETQLANLQKMIYDLNKQAQISLKALLKHKQSLTVYHQKAKSDHQRRIKVKFNDSFITEMTNLYDEYNGYSVAVESMAQRYALYYKDPNLIKEQQCALFSDCVSCSQRLLTQMCGLTQNFHTSNRSTIYMTNEFSEFYMILGQALISPITLNEKYMFAQQLSSQQNQLIIQNRGAQLQVLQEEQNQFLDLLIDTYDRRDTSDQKYFQVLSAKILVWSASASLSSSWQKSYQHDPQVVEQLVNHRKQFQGFLAEALKHSQLVAGFNIYCLNGPLYNLLLVTDKLVKQLSGIKSMEGKRKKVDAGDVVVKQVNKEDQESNKKQLQSQCVKFFADVFNLKDKQSMEIEYTLDSKINFKVEDNMISRLLLLTDNFELTDSLKSILVISASLDFQLAVGAMLNVSSIVQSVQYFEIFQLLKSSHGKKVQGLAEYLSLVEHLLDLAINLLEDQSVQDTTPIMNLVQLIKRFLEMAQPDFPQFCKELETRQLAILFQLLSLQKIASTYTYDSNIIEVHQLMPDLYKICAPQQSQKLYELLLNELFSKHNQPQHVQRIADMLHQRIFTNLEYKIRAQANRQAEEYIHKRHLEISSRDLPRELGGGIIVETLKRKIKEDLQLEMDFDIVVCSKLIDDTSRSLDTIYSRFYLTEIVRADFLQTKGQSFRNDEDSQSKVNAKVKEILLGASLPTMNVEFCIRGIGNHDQLPYLPHINDEDMMQQQEQLIRALLMKPNPTNTFQEGAIVLFFRVLQKLVAQQMFNLTIKKLVELIRFVSKSQEVKREVFGCQGLVILLRVFLMDPNELNNFQLGLIQTMTDLLVAAQEDLSLARGPTNKRRLSEHMDQRDVLYFERESTTNLKMVLQNLDSLQSNPSVVKVFLQITPLIVRDLNEPCFQLFDYFKAFLDFSHTENIIKIDNFSQIVYYTPVHYCVLRNLILEQGVFQSAFDYLKQVEATLEGESVFLHTVDLAQSALRIISSVAKGKPQIQSQLLREGALQLILKLSSSSAESMKHCSKICEDLVQFLKSDQNEVDPSVNALVKGSFEATEQAKKVLAQSKRTEMMKRFQRNNQPYQEKLKLMDDEKGLYCQTCKEGYTLNPDNLLGVYLYTIPDRIIDEGLMEGDNLIPQFYGVHSVTYFTVMHLACHKKAVEYAIKVSRKEQDETGVRRSGEEVEWECAQKNNVAKCNNFFPIKPMKNPQLIEEGLRFYMQRSEHICRSKLQSLFWIILNDLRSLLVKFAKEEDLARDTGAGRYEHNIKLIPFYISTLLYLIEINNDYLTNLTKILFIPHDSNILELMICSSILLIQPCEWSQRKVLYFEMVTKLCAATRDVDIMLSKENKYLLNLLALMSLVYDALESPKFNKKLIESEYFKILNMLISEDNLKVIKLFEAIEREYSQHVLKATTMSDYKKYLN